MRALVLALAVLCVFPGWAQQLDRPVTVEDMVQSLTPPAKTRSFGTATQGGKTRNLVVGIDLTINFEFDSARLSEDGRAQLKNLAMALSDARLAEFRFRVEGHTDARGTAQYNDQLSGRRARAVLDFLVSNGIASGRLVAEGKGFRELADQMEPLSPKNRRVRVVTLDP